VITHSYGIDMFHVLLIVLVTAVAMRCDLFLYIVYIVSLSVLFAPFVFFSILHVWMYDAVHCVLIPLCETLSQLSRQSVCLLRGLPSRLYYDFAQLFICLSSNSKTEKM